MNDVTPTGRTCEVCGGSIHQDNTLGICGRTPECRTARNLKKRRSLPRPEKRTCSVCDQPIRSDNTMGICQRTTECKAARWRHLQENGPMGKERYCEVCGRQLRRDNSLGVCYGRGSDACAKERERRRGQVRRHGIVPASMEGWMRPPYIATGAVFGRLTVLEDVMRSQDPARVRCSCERRTEKEIKRAVDLTMGTTRSCGCLRRELLTTHGLHKHPLYATWNGIIQRVTNPKDARYPNYGGRGIKVSERWLDARVFVEDIEREIGPRPEGVTEAGFPLYTLDRIDVEGHYESGNVKWSTASEQLLNRRKVPDLDERIRELTAQIQALTERESRKRKEPPADSGMEALF